jgi:hypothetical protein
VNEFLNDIIREARGLPRQDSAKAQKEMIEEFSKRGDALNQIIIIIDDKNLSESERLNSARAIAVDTLLKPEF